MRAGVISLLAAALATVVLSLGGEEDTARADLSLPAASATITVDGDDSDWAGIDGLTLTLAQFEIPQGSDWEYDALDPLQAEVKAASDAERIYLLFKVFDDYDFDPNDGKLSGSANAMFRIEQAAGPHMGSGDQDFEQSLGMVDLWHWELGCGPGEIAGGGVPGSGDDPDCNLDDEFSTEPEERDDDGDGPVANPAAENSLTGVWDHTGRAGGAGAEGAWIFELSRPLQTGDPEDAQFAQSASAFLAVAYFDADESSIGWSDAGHLTSAGEGWIEVLIPGPDATQPPAATAAPGTSPTPTSAPPADGDSDVEAEITVSPDPRVGDPAEVQVRLTSTTDGAPVAGARVRLLREATFADVTGRVELAAAITDEDGQAEMEFVPRRAGNQDLVIEYLLADADEPASAVQSLAVAEGGQIYRSEAGVDIPGLGVWVIIAVATTVWVILIVVAARVIAIARATGVPEEAAVRRLGGLGRLDEKARLSGTGALDRDKRLSESGALDEDERLSEPGRLEDDE
ncbi:MAG TPA: ethylbenzene dehydrogenase-related protein [Dehalococcoidia bacterium]